MARSYVRVAQNYQWKINHVPPILKGSFRQMLETLEYQQKCFLLVYRLHKKKTLLHQRLPEREAKVLQDGRLLKKEIKCPTETEAFYI